MLLTEGFPVNAGDKKKYVKIQEYMSLNKWVHLFFGEWIEGLDQYFFTIVISFLAPILVGVLYGDESSGCFSNGSLFSFGNDGGIGSHHPKKDPAFFCVCVSCIYFLQEIMIFLVSKTAFQPGASFFVQHSPHHFALFYVL